MNTDPRRPDHPDAQDTVPSQYLDEASPSSVSPREPAGVSAPVFRWAWLGEGARSIFFLMPRWQRVQVGPWGLAACMGCAVAMAVLLQWMLMDGALRFHWQAIAGGWLGVLISLWACWMAAGRPALSASPDVAPAQGASALFALVLVQTLLVQGVLGAALVLAVRMTWWPVPDAGPWLAWGVYGLMLLWPALAAGWMLCRHSVRWPVRLVVGLAALGAAAVTAAVPPTPFWYPDEPAMDEASIEAARAEYESQRLHLTQEALEAQTTTLIESLDAVQPQRPGVVDLYAITFAPVADEDVFSREAGMVSEVMRQRFDAQGRSLQLQNHARSVGQMPWATPLNLQRAIGRMAERMDREEDVLFIHLTSHGGRNGQLAANFGPLDVASVTPEKLKTWLDEAGVRNRVISVSACYAGSWVAPLADEHTLVMTAADATHTSYGCGRKSELTFFGRAMYDEQLRTQTRSFEAAHAAARPLIDQRERAAGKSDGYSNPQIQVGPGIRPVLQALESRLAQAPAPDSEAAAQAVR